jgi:hypothetical protein
LRPAAPPEAVRAGEPGARETERAAVGLQPVGSQP